MNLVKMMTDQELESEVTDLRSKERSLRSLRTKAAKAKAAALWPRITELALEQGERWRKSLGIRNSHDSE